MWLTVFYEIMIIILILLFVWNMLTSKDRAKQISTVVVLVPLLLRALYIH